MPLFWKHKQRDAFWILVHVLSKCIPGYECETWSFLWERIQIEGFKNGTHEEDIWPENRELTRGWRKLHGDELQQDKIGGECETFRRNEKYLQNCCLKNLKAVCSRNLKE